MRNQWRKFELTYLEGAIIFYCYGACRVYFEFNELLEATNANVGRAVNHGGETLKVWKALWCDGNVQIERLNMLIFMWSRVGD